MQLVYVLSAKILLLGPSPQMAMQCEPWTKVLDIDVCGSWTYEVDSLQWWIGILSACDW